MSDSNFLCGNCRNVLCDDCRDIADEYAELLIMRSNALSTANYEIEKLKADLSFTKRQAAMWEELSKMGMPEIILKWMDSLKVTA